MVLYEFSSRHIDGIMKHIKYDITEGLGIKCTTDDIQNVN